MSRPNIGIYVYGWYDREKWTNHQFPLRPQVGFYRSGDPLIARWQVDQIARTGVDFVAFEMVPHTDHSFESICEHIRNCVPLLTDRGIGYSMFMDNLIFRDVADHLRIYTETLERLDHEGWLAGSFECTGLGKPLFHFAPRILHVPDLKARTPPNMNWWASIWSPEWGHIRPERYSPAVRDILSPDWTDAVERGVKLSESLEEMGYFPFWTYNDEMPVMNGVASVAAGYDDLMLRRDPQLAQPLDFANGRTLHTQFRNAQASDAHTVMIYGWNEYFESAVIEPTLNCGDFYLRLTAHFVSQLKSGEQISWPDWAREPEAANPIYLSPELALSGQLHADGLPRWDQDDWRADLSGPQSVARLDETLRFDGVTVTNVGLKTWPIHLHGAPIRLGVRLFDRSGEVQREGRAELAKSDVRPSTTLAQSVDVDISGLPTGHYRAEIGVVWEGRMWFHPIGGEPLLRTIEIE